MRSTNFEFIREYRPDLADEAATIESSFHHSVASAIDLLRTFGQRLAQHFIHAKGRSIRDSNRRTYGLDDLLQTYATDFPEPQRRLFDELRKEGNLQHEPKYQPTLREERQLRVAWELACWVGKQLGWQNIPIQFNPPPKGGHELDEMRRQRNEALERESEAKRSFDVSGWVLRPEEQDLSAPANFVGREFVFGKIKRFLESSECRVLLIQGQPGRGKTAIIQKFVSDEIPPGITPFVFRFEDQSSQVGPNRWVRHLFASLVQRWQLDPPHRSIQGADLEDLVQQLRNRITDVAVKHPGERLLFVLDAVDEAGLAEKTVVSFLQSEFHNTVQVIVTARPDHVSFSSSRTDRQSRIQVLDLDDPDLWNNHQADGLRFVTATMPSLEPDAIKKVVQLGDGNFLLLLLICRELREIPKVTIANNLRELDLLKGGKSDFANELFRRSWQRLERLDANELDTVEKVATLLANARVPLSERIIRDTLRLRRADWVKAQQHFGEYLARSQWQPSFNAESIDVNGVRGSEENDEPVSVFRLFHQMFADFVRQHLKDDLAESKSQLADYCREQLKKRKPSYEYAYALRFGPAHLMRAAEHNPRHWNQLEELLTDIFFLEAKAQGGFVFDLATDLSSAWQAMPSDRPMRTILKLLAEAIRREIYFIDEHAVDYPQGLFQCVWNLAWWYGNPEAAPYYQHDDKKDSHDGTVDSPEANGQREVGTALVQLLERWRREKKSVTPGFHWLRSRRPPDATLGGAQLTVIPESRGGGWWVDCSADGKRIVGGGFVSLRVWDTDTLTEVARMPDGDYLLPAAAVSPDGNVVIVVHREQGETRSSAGGTENSDWVQSLAAWDIRSGKVRTISHLHAHGISDIAFSPDGTRFATASGNTTIRIWDAKTFEEVLVLDGCESEVDSVCFSHDSRRIMAGSADAIRIWDVSNGQQVSVFWIEKNDTNHLFQPKLRVNKVCFSPDGTRIAARLLGEIIILNAATGNVLVRAIINIDQFDSYDSYDCICFSPDGKRIACALSETGLIVILDATTGQTIRQIGGHEVCSLCFLPDGKRIVGGSADGIIRIWNVADNGPSAAVLVGGAPWDEIDGFLFVEDGKKLLSHSFGTQRLWDGQSGLPLRAFESGGYELKYAANGNISGEVCQPDQDQDLVLLQVRDTRTDNVLFSRPVKRRLLDYKFSLSPDGKKIAFTDVASGEEHVAEIFDVSRGHELVRLKGHEYAINHLCFSSDGAQIATASNDHTVRIWDAVTGDLLTQIHHDAAVHKVWFSPDGTQIVSFEEKGGLRVFDSDGGIEYFVLDQNVQRINELCFSSDGTRIVADASGSICIWDAKTGELLKVIQGRGDIKGIAANVKDTSFRLLVRDGDTIVETASGQIVARYRGKFDYITTHPDGRTWAGTISNYLALIHLEG